MTFKGVKKLIKRSLSFGKTRTTDHDTSCCAGGGDETTTGGKFKRTNTAETEKEEEEESSYHHSSTSSAAPPRKQQRGSLLLRMVMVGGGVPINNSASSSGTSIDDSMWTRITRLGVCDEGDGEEDVSTVVAGEQQPTPATYPDPSSLLARVGGASVLNSVVDMFQDMVNEDKALMDIFVGLNPTIMALHQKRFLSMAFTQIPKGISIENTIMNQHMHLFQEKGLDETHFDRMVQHLVAAMEDNNLSQTMIQEAVATITPLRIIFQDGARQYPKKEQGGEEDVVDGIDDSYKLSGSDYKKSTRRTPVVEQSLLLNSTCWKSEELRMFPTEVESMFITWDSRLRNSVFPGTMEASKLRRSAFPMGNGSNSSNASRRRQNKDQRPTQQQQS